MALCFGFSKALFRVVLVSAIVLFALLSPSAAATPKPSAAAATPSSAPSSTAAAPAPAPGPTSDGTSIDQGIAYVLMLVALVLTYLIHPLDASASYNFF